jgi:hypothetical protein
MEILAHFSPTPPPLSADLTHPVWQTATPLPLAYNWRGEAAPNELHTLVRLVWTREQLWLGFEGGYTELDVDEQFDVQQERYALWERDVCEVFIRSPLEPRLDSYKEFEVAPTGQWCDLLIHRPRVDFDWQWQSGLQTAAEIDALRQIFRVVLAIPFSAFGLTPQAGEQWHGNLYRISRLNQARQFLAFAPTLTETPDYHLPEKFVPLVFLP